MSERKFYVICDDNCKFEGMTKEQIIAAISEATGTAPTHVDDAFITKIRESNQNKNLKFWIGTTAEYNALAEKILDTFYILTDETSFADLEEDISMIRKSIEGIDENFTNTSVRLSTVETDVQKLKNDIQNNVQIAYPKFYGRDSGKYVGTLTYIRNGNIVSLSGTLNIENATDTQFYAVLPHAYVAVGDVRQYAYVLGHNTQTQRPFNGMVVLGLSDKLSMDGHPSGTLLDIEVHSNNVIPETRSRLWIYPNFTMGVYERGLG